MTSLAASLMVVFVAAKLIVLGGRAVPGSVWTPFVYLWQDVAVVLAFLVIQKVVRKRWLYVPVYAALVLLAAINVPVIRAMSSPLTAPMLRAARGALADSITHYVTAANIGALAVVLMLGAFLPMVAQSHWPPWIKSGRAWLAVALVEVVAGAFGASRIDTSGFERNGLVALVRTSFARVPAQPAVADWRMSPFARPASDDLSPLRGAARDRNVLIVVLESTGARYVRTYGAADDPMPNLTALAARSIVFENAYTLYPESIKGLAATIASRYPAFDIAAARHAGTMSSSLATTLAAHGYHTGLFHSGRFMYLGMDEILAGSGFQTLEDAGAIGGNRNSSFGIDEPAAVNRILSWIDSVPRPRPFFAMYLPIAGHHPYATNEPGPFPDRDDIDRYRNALHEGDHALGTLLEGLRARGLDGSTLVVVFGDHGEAFGQHSGNYGHTLEIYDENVRVPLLIAMPGGASAPARVRSVASLIDVPPTVLDLLGLAPPTEIDGASLLDGRARMALFFTDYSLGLLGLRDGCTKYVHELESGRSRMFDLCADPDERVDIAARFADRSAVYRDHLKRWSGAQVARIAR